MYKAKYIQSTKLSGQVKWLIKSQSNLANNCSKSEF